MATELCSGTLEEYVEGTYQGPRFENEKKMLHQVTKGLAHLHRMNIVHRDVKSTNILIFILRSGEFVKPLIKLADFGFSNILRDGVGENENIENPSGTLGWIAPEMYNSGYFDFKSDIFTLGCVFGYSLTGGKHPFGEVTFERDNRIRRGGTMVLVANDLNTPQSYNRSAIDLIQSMLNSSDPNDRPTAEQILNNTYFQRSPEQLQINPQGNKNILTKIIIFFSQLIHIFN